MKIEQLEFLIEVCRAGSINAASKKIFISQQSLNQSLRNLEEELGFTVLNRTKRGVTLTKQGLMVYSAAQAIVARYDQMLDQINASELNHLDTLYGKLNIHLSPMVSISLMPLVYVDYMHTHPKVQVYLQERYQDDIVAEVAQNPGDVGFVLIANSLKYFVDNIPQNVELQLLKSYPIYIAMSPRHPLAHQHNLSLASIADYPFIIYETGGPEGEHALQNVVDLHILLSTNNYNMCRELLNEGNTLIYSFPPYIRRSVFADCVHIPLNLKDITFQLYMVYNKRAGANEKRLMESFSATLQNYL